MRSLINIQDKQHVLITDALRYTLYLEYKSFSSMRRSLRYIENDDDGTGHPNIETSLNALNYAWNIVDAVHRCRKLVSQVPRLSQRNSEVQVFLRNTQQVERFRNLYQHLSSEIPRMRGEANPIMGVLSWVTKEPTKSMTIFVGTGAPNINVHTVAYDREKHELTPPLLFSAGNKDLDLESIHVHCRRYGRFFDNWLDDNGCMSKETATVGVIRFQIYES